VKILLGGNVHADLRKLIVSRLLLQANSGGGKSWALRRLLEQTHGHVQQIVIDPEDEFYTLREKYDYILVRHEDGDCVPEIRSAELLATRLLELGVSAIISLYELHPRDRREFVKRFLNSLVNAPKKLWHRALIVVDEAHEFCPEQGKQQKGDAVADAVIGLMSKGRKRGFCGVLATQRLSKLNKDAAAEAKNKLIGNAVLDLDRKRAAEELGFSSKEQTLSLRNLEAGEFYGFGPAISREAVKFRFGGVETTHPEAGSSPAPVAAPKSKVQSVLAKLADLPQEAEQERVTIADLQRQVRDLTQQLKAAAKAQPAAPKPDPKQQIRAAQLNKAQRALEAVMKFIVEITTRNFDSSVPEKEVRAAINGAVDNALKKVQAVMDARSSELLRLKKDASEILRRIKTIVDSDVPVKVEVRHNEPFTVTPPATPTERRATAPSAAPADGSSPTGGLRRILIALAQRPNGLTNRQIGVRAGLSSKGGTFSTYLSRARTNGWIEGDKSAIRITEAGKDALQTWEDLPGGEQLYQYWLGQLGESGAARILRALYEAYPNTLTKNEVADRAGISAAGGSFSTYLSRLRSLELITGNKELKASDEFFE
jgi:hypothetical protein